MTAPWAGRVTLALFLVGGLLGMTLVKVVEVRLRHRDPADYWGAWRRRELLSLPYLRSRTSRWEFGTLVAGFSLLGSLLLWLLIATLSGWLK